MPRKNPMIERIAKEYEGLTYKPEPYDFEALEEPNYTLITVTDKKDCESNNKPQELQQKTTEKKENNKWKRFSLCKRCAYIQVCNGPCAMVIDYVGEDKEEEKEDITETR